MWLLGIALSLLELTVFCNRMDVVWKMTFDMGFSPMNILLTS